MHLRITSIDCQEIWIHWILHLYSFNKISAHFDQNLGLKDTSCSLFAFRTKSLNPIPLPPFSPLNLLYPSCSPQLASFLDIPAKQTVTAPRFYIFNRWPCLRWLNPDRPLFEYTGLSTAQPLVVTFAARYHSTFSFFLSHTWGSTKVDPLFLELVPASPLPLSAPLTFHSQGTLFSPQLTRLLLHVRYPMERRHWLLHADHEAFNLLFHQASYLFRDGAAFQYIFRKQINTQSPR